MYHIYKKSRYNIGSFLTNINSAILSNKSALTKQRQCQLVALISL